MNTITTNDRVETVIASYGIPARIIGDEGNRSMARVILNTEIPNNKQIRNDIRTATGANKVTIDGFNIILDFTPRKPAQDKSRNINNTETTRVYRPDSTEQQTLSIAWAIAAGLFLLGIIVLLVIIGL